MTARAVVRIVRVAVLWSLCAAGLISCAGNGEGLDDAGNPIKAAGETLVATLDATKDNTLYENATGLLSNGVGEHLFAGRTGTGAIRRGILAFDIAQSIPAGSHVTGVTLTLHLSREPATGGPEVIELHALTADWGEGTSHAAGMEGGGGAATTGDATWIHTFSATDFWNTPGGDFSPTVSASQTVDAIGFYSWTGAGLVTDVQSWLDHPQNNFGWVLVGDESAPQTAKRFDSRENTDTSLRPVLSVQYTTAP